VLHLGIIDAFVLRVPRLDFSARPGSVQVLLQRQVRGVDTNALRRVGVELDDEWGHEQAGSNISLDIRQCSGGAAGHASITQGRG
jgi:hypothetical protein